ncbi:MAG: MCE family protein [Candidatus Omnitrophica bacterium]|nr:MCE family protein [Candidatus Omnitrophota bacterium]MBU1995848.1 MCE family protein [Candidatus Omnitrophota bacterium]MBU4334143.1 MCE family protein [Candidatus Omnitrophota bacterium]
MKINNETKIGMMITGIVIVLATLTIRTENFKVTKDGYRVRVHFQDIDGVNLNSPVMFNGFEVGIVEDVVIRDDNDGTKMELVLWLENKAKLRKGSKAFVKNLGFMGEKYVGLTSGDNDKPYLEENSLIIGQSPADFGQLVSDGQVIASQLKEISQNINERLNINKEHIDSVLLNADLTLKNMSSVTDRIDKKIRSNEDNINNIAENLNKTSANLSLMTSNLEELTFDLKLHPWKILHRTKEKSEEKIED